MNEAVVIGGVLFALRFMAGVRWVLPLAGERFAGEFDIATRKYGLPKGLLARVAYQESHFREDVIRGFTKSPAGAVGLMQIVPSAHPGVDATNPHDSIQYAAKYLAAMRKKFGSWRYALAAYNWGPGNLAKYLKHPKNIKMPKETVNYVTQISHDIGL